MFVTISQRIESWLFEWEAVPEKDGRVTEHRLRHERRSGRRSLRIWRECSREMAIEGGSRLGHYKVLALLGAGGMGEVYVAQDTRLGRKIALKVLSEDVTKNKERVSRFQQEARAASALNHPNIITIHEVGQEETIHLVDRSYPACLGFRLA